MWKVALMGAACVACLGIAGAAFKVLPSSKAVAQVMSSRHFDFNAEKVKAEGIETLKNALSDPESLRLKNVSVHFVDKDHDPNVCGDSNAKNRYGGYTGYSGFIISGPTVIDESENPKIKDETGHIRGFDYFWSVACERAREVKGDVYD